MCNFLANFYLDVLGSPNNVEWPENAQILPFPLKFEGRYDSVVEVEVEELNLHKRFRACLRRKFRSKCVFPLYSNTAAAYPNNIVYSFPLYFNVTG